MSSRRGCYIPEYHLVEHKGNCKWPTYGPLDSKSRALTASVCMQLRLGWSLVGTSQSMSLSNPLPPSIYPSAGGDLKTGIRSANSTAGTKMLP